MQPNTIIVDQDVVNALMKEFDKFKQNKKAMFTNKGGSIIKNSNTSNMMSRIVEISVRLYSLKNTNKAFTVHEFRNLMNRYDMLANAILKCKDFNMDYARDIEEMREVFQSLDVAIKLLD